MFLTNSYRNDCNNLNDALKIKTRTCFIVWPITFVDLFKFSWRIKTGIKYLVVELDLVLLSNLQYRQRPSKKGVD